MGLDVDEKGYPLKGISFTAYLARLNPPKATRDLFSAWWTVSGNGGHGSVTASEFLHSCGHGDGLAEAIMDCWADTVSPGMAVLAERMIERSKAKLHLETPVAGIAQTKNKVSVSTAAGQTFEAAYCVVALGVNQLKAVTFTPPLSPSKQAAVTRGHDGRAFKLWIMARGVPVGTLVTGDGTGIEFAFAEREGENGTTMIIGFGLDNGASRPGDPRWVKDEISRLFPNAEVIASDWHDWVNDPFACGTWVAAPVGFEAGLGHDNWQAEARIAFATSDTARENAGWFEGAVGAGEDAAGAILAKAS
jgi:monoamine oxidase